MSKFKLIHGDCLEKTNTLISANMWVDSVVTDPPYGLKFMGKDWDHGIPGKHFWETIMQTMDLPELSRSTSRRAKRFMGRRTQAKID